MAPLALALFDSNAIDAFLKGVEPGAGTLDDHLRPPPALRADEHVTVGGPITGAAHTLPAKARFDRLHGVP